MALTNTHRQRFHIGINSIFLDLSSMSEHKKEGLSQLAAMLEVYLQQEVTPELPPSCRDLLTLIAKVSQAKCVSYCSNTKGEIKEKTLTIGRTDL